VQTVRPLAAALGLPVETHPDLREWDSGIDPRPDYADLYAESWAEPGRARPGGESLRDLSACAVAALTAVAGDGTVVVGSHGTFVARALVGFGVGGVDWAFCRAMPMPAVYRLRRGARRARHRRDQDPGAAGAGRRAGVPARGGQYGRAPTSVTACSAPSRVNRSS
jgi:2,3-bisphosphoglycerate-dependent phosphoglycerate mutase